MALSLALLKELLNPFLDVCDVLGYAYKDLTHEFISSNRFNYNDDTDIGWIADGIKQLFIVHNAVVAEKQVISYADFIPYSRSPTVELVSQVPVFNPAGEVVAVQAISIANSVFGINEYFYNWQGQIGLWQLNTSRPESDITEREYEVLFLLHCQLSQAEIASILMLHHGTVSTLVNRLCKKFGMTGLSIKILLAKSAEMNANKYIPKRFRSRQIMVLDSEIRAKYFPS